MACFLDADSFQLLGMAVLHIDQAFGNPGPKKLLQVHGHGRRGLPRSRHKDSFILGQVVLLIPDAQDLVPQGDMGGEDGLGLHRMNGMEEYLLRIPPERV